LIAACASRDFKPLEFPEPVKLQDPLPGQAFVYLLRAPHDPPAVSVYVNKAKIAVLPRETYTGVSARPGRYELFATVGEQAPIEPPSYGPTILTLAPGERRFIYTSQPTHSSSSMFLAPFGVAGVVPLVVASKVPAGARSWHECGELDAQGLMSISRYVRAQQDEL
jgi:hypothetical protein